mgnify:CR=1 FL=1
MKKITLIIFLFFITGSVMSQKEYTPSKENLEAREWFKNAKFGLFIHWGVYSILGDGEWVMTNQNIKVNRYELLPEFFNPVEFDAKEIVQLAKDAGMKYITITTKHHDGFAMYDSKVSDYNIVKATPYGKDIFRQLEQECKKQGIKLFAYYSQLDWHHSDYFPRGYTGKGVGREKSGNWNQYIAYQNAQIKELAENYDIAGFWFDGFWDTLKEKGRTPETRKEGLNHWKLEETYKMIHDVKSGLLLGNNHHLKPFIGEDFQMFEKDLPGNSTTSFGNARVSQLPLETCETINHSWGFNLQDNKHKSVKELIRYLVKSASKNANFLLNVGPMPNGKIQKEHIDRLQSIGKWLKQNGETIYGTTAGIINSSEKMVSTQKGKKIYLHIFQFQDRIIIPDFNHKIKSIKYFKDKSEVRYKQSKKEVSLSLSKNKNDAIDIILEITLK